VEETMGQMTLFGSGDETEDRDAPYVVGSATSKAAAEAITVTAGTLRGKVYAAICTAGPTGHTDQEIQKLLGMDPSTERPRRIELTRAKLVADSGLTRETESGRRATVWVALGAILQPGTDEGDDL
jgi:hypothetical protein